MKTALLLCAATWLSALVGAQSQQPPLSYRGWALGISLDSASSLTQAQTGKRLVCVGEATRTMFCQTDQTPGAHMGLYFGPVPRRLEEVSLVAPLDRRASKDSLEKWFTTRWGPPILREMIGSKSTSTRRGGLVTDVIGSWARDGMIFGTVGIGSYDTTRLLSVSISTPAREIRLLRERADSSHKR